MILVKTLHPQRTREGFALLMTIVLLAIASMALVAVSGSTIRHAMNVEQHVRALQQRWGSASVEAALASRASTILEGEERSSRQALPYVDLSFSLNTQTFDVRIADEQAKFDPNSLDADGEGAADEIQRRLADLLAASDRDYHLRLRPATTRAGGSPYPSFGHLFEAPRIQDLRPDRRGDAAFDLITCWGTGSVNVLRSPDRVLHIWFDQSLGPAAVSRMLTLRKGGLQMGLVQLADEMLLTDAGRAFFLAHATLRSRRFSLWIEHPGGVRIVAIDGDRTTAALELP